MVIIDVSGKPTLSETHCYNSVKEPLYAETAEEEIVFSWRNLSIPSIAPLCFERLLVLAPEKAPSGIDIYLKAMAKYSPNDELGQHFLDIIYPAIKEHGLEKKFEECGFYVTEEVIPGTPEKKRIEVEFNGTTYRRAY